MDGLSMLFDAGVLSEFPGAKMSGLLDGGWRSTGVPVTERSQAWLPTLDLIAMCGTGGGSGREKTPEHIPIPWLVAAFTGL